MLNRKKKILRRLRRTFLKPLARLAASRGIGFLDQTLIGRNAHAEEGTKGLPDYRISYREFFESVVQYDKTGKKPEFSPAGYIWRIDLERFRFWFDMADRDVGITVAIGQYELDSVRFVEEFVRPGMKCIDIGASSGYYTCLLASIVGPKGHVYAFEPRPSNVEMLKRNVCENQFDAIVEIHDSACSDESGNLVGSDMAGMYLTGEVKGAEKVTMKAVRVDDIVEGKVDFVKIDIEGHEPAGIRGMQSLMRDSRPVILTEVNEYWLRTVSGGGGKEYLNLLESLDYRIFKVGALDSPLDLEQIEFDIEDIMDVVAIPN